jgi:hypothetical protein
MRTLAGRKALVTGNSRDLGEVIAAGTPARFTTAYDGVFATRPCPPRARRPGHNHLEGPHE